MLTTRDKCMFVVAGIGMFLAIPEDMPMIAFFILTFGTAIVGVVLIALVGSGRTEPKDTTTTKKVRYEPDDWLDPGITRRARR